MIGYGGNDGSLMKCLEDLPECSIPGGIYWCFREGTEPPPPRIRNLIAKQRGKLVPILGFDELLMQFGNVLGYGVPDQYVLDRAKERAERIVKQAQALQKRIQERDEAAMHAAALPSSPDDPAAASAELAGVSKAMSETMQRKEGEKRWWQWETEAAAEPDAQKRDGIYQDAIKALPTSAPLLGNYALFLKNVRKDPDAAEAMYKRAVEADPKHANSLGNYAVFLADVRKDPDAAEGMYKRALEADPKHANSLGNYANFLKNVRTDPDAAEAMYKRAVEADPKHALHLGNYANFLAFVRKDPDAAEAMYKRALEADPKHALHLGNYANFLADVRKDPDAAEAMYHRAVEADPKHANNLGNYALFLKNVRKDPDAAEAMYKRAVEADPKHANSLGNYAVFLADVRKDPDAAEAMYKRALEADPKRANTFGNYARHLLGAGRVEEGLGTLDAAFAAMADGDPPALAAECWMYAYCCRSPSARPEALTRLKSLIVEHGIRTGDWSFSGVIAQAATLKHPEADWLPKLADVLAEQLDPTALDAWDAWREA